MISYYIVLYYTNMNITEPTIYNVYYGIVFGIISVLLRLNYVN